MPRRDWTIRIADILEAVRKFLRYVASMTLERLAQDEKTVDDAHVRTGGEDVLANGGAENE